MSIPSLRMPPTALLDPIAEASDRLLRTADRLDDAALRAPSRLPGWSRAHVLTHLSRGADSRVRLLTAARTGAAIPQYASEAERSREIEEGARRPREEILADLRASADRLAQAIAEHPPDRWGRPVRWLGGPERPVDDVASSRLQELEIHHVDLDAGYGCRDWPDWFARDELRVAVDRLRGSARLGDVELHAVDTGERHLFGDRPERCVRGDTKELLAWLIRRDDGTGLIVEPPGRLPEPPSWE